MTTPRDIIMLAMRDTNAVGEGQDPSVEDVNDSFTRLNWMLAQWQRKRWLVPYLQDLSVTSTGAQTYSIGPGGDIATPTRPDKIEAAYVRQNAAGQTTLVDYQLDLLVAREDYAELALKSLAGFPQSLFYLNDYPLGHLYPWPVPAAGTYTLHVLVKAILGQLTSLDQDLSGMPEEYFPAMEYNLAYRLYPQYGNLASHKNIEALAKDSLNVIRQANSQIARLNMPADLMRSGRYNILSDQNR